MRRPVDDGERVAVVTPRQRLAQVPSKCITMLFRGDNHCEVSGTARVSLGAHLKPRSCTLDQLAAREAMLKDIKVQCQGQSAQQSVIAQERVPRIDIATPERQLAPGDEVDDNSEQ